MRPIHRRANAVSKVLVVVEVPAVCPHCAALGAKRAVPPDPGGFGFCNACHGTFRYLDDGQTVRIMRKDEPRELGPAYPLVCRMRESLGPRSVA